MAYNVTTDYKALQDALKKQKEAATNSATQAALQSQIDAAQSSKEQKIASDLTAYGKYANDSELNNAAGIMAQNQLGTGYDIQRANLNRSYDNARQNANNDALSRGMARSSFVSDRLAGLDSDRATALSGVDASQAMALQNARTNILNDYRTNTANALSNEKKEYADTIGAYYGDYQAKVNNVQGDNDPSNDWKIPYLQQARNEKLQAQQAAALKAAKTSYSGGGGGGKNATMTFSQLNTAVGQVLDNQSPEAAYSFITENGGQYANQLLAMYNLSAPAPTPPRTSNYGSSTVTDVNTALNAGYTQQQIIDAARTQYGVNTKQYNEIVSALIRNR